MATGDQGKRAGSRRGTPGPRPEKGRLLALALGITVAGLAWGYLVYAAIDFGSTARGGDDQAWWFLGLASLGAVACLFVAFLLVARLLRRLGVTGEPPARTEAPTTPGGRRAAR